MTSLRRRADGVYIALHRPCGALVARWNTFTGSVNIDKVTRAYRTKLEGVVDYLNTETLGGPYRLDPEPAMTKYDTHDLAPLRAALGANQTCGIGWMCGEIEALRLGRDAARGALSLLAGALGVGDDLAAMLRRIEALSDAEGERDALREQMREVDHTLDPDCPISPERRIDLLRKAVQALRDAEKAAYGVEEAEGPPGPERTTRLIPEEDSDGLYRWLVEGDDYDCDPIVQLDAQTFDAYGADDDGNPELCTYLGDFPTLADALEALNVHEPTRARWGRLVLA